MRFHWILLGLLFASGGCGNKSKVDPLFKAVPTRVSHGDGTYTVFTFKLPLSERSLDSYDSPVDPTTGVARVPVVGDLLRLVTRATFSLGSGLGIGRSRIAINQSIPEIDMETLKQVSVKRVFFHIDHKDALVDRRPRSWIARIRRFIGGGGNLDFGFLRELKIRMSMHRDPGEPDSFIPRVLDDATETASERRAPRLDFLTYRKRNRQRYLNPGVTDHMYIIYAQEPVKTRNYLNGNSEFKEVIREITRVGKTLMVELEGGAVEREMFFELLERHEGAMGELGITKIDPCKAMTCMDLKVVRDNLLPFLVQGNRLRIDTEVDASQVPPESFQLKGFIEFEVKVDIPL